MRPALNTRGIIAALRKGGNSHFRVEVLPGLNHLFQNAETGLPTEYAKIEETISPGVLEMISEWILLVVRFEETEKP